MPRENPFNVTKAVDLDDKQIGDYWVDLPGSGGFKDLVKPHVANADDYSWWKGKRKDSYSALLLVPGPAHAA